MDKLQRWRDVAKKVVRDADDVDLTLDDIHARLRSPVALGTFKKYFQPQTSRPPASPEKLLRQIAALVGEKGRKSDVAYVEDWWPSGKEKGGTGAERVALLDARDESVHAFIQSRRFIERSKEICIWLYTAETIVSFLRSELDRHRPEGLVIRVLVQDAAFAEGTVAVSVKHGLGLLEECAKAYPQVSLQYAVYNHDPFFRMFSFTGPDGAQSGLVGVYYHEPGKPRRIIGAEANEMIICDGRTDYGARMLSRYQSRFDLAWAELAKKKRPGKER